MSRRIAFVLAASDHGSMIVNRLDYHIVSPDHGFGVGWELLESGGFARSEVGAGRQLLELRRAHHGDGVVAVDCGANIGVHTIEWARHMDAWGSVIAIEAQERIFYALAGNIALNNCFNARAIHAAVASQDGEMGIPLPDYQRPASFGSLELRNTEHTEFIGQEVDYAEEKLARVATITIDSLALPRLDMLKIDVEGMELEVLEGAVRSIDTMHPLILAEHIKSDATRLTGLLEAAGYRVIPFGINLLAVHTTDPVNEKITVT